jgi:DnaA family protein
MRRSRGLGDVYKRQDLSSLMTLLDHLDQFALQTQRAITIPLIKSMLENT